MTLPIRDCARTSYSSSGLSALVLDTDVVLLSDPFKHLQSDADLEVSGLRCRFSG